MIDQTGEGLPIPAPTEIVKPTLPVVQAPTASETRNNSFSHLLNEIGGNTDLEHAQVIFIGEAHRDLIHELQIGDFLREHAKEGDVVLLEDVARGAEVSPDDQRRTKYMNIPKTLQVKGWDDMELVSQALDSIRRLDSTTKGGLSIEEMRKIQDEYQAKYNDVTVIQRNKSLMAAINDELKAGRSRIFVVAGVAHYDSDPELEKHLGTMQFIAYKAETPEDLRQKVASAMGEKAPQPQRAIVNTVVQAARADIYQAALQDSEIKDLGISIGRVEGGPDAYFEDNEQKTRVSLSSGYSRVTIDAAKPDDISAFWKAVGKLTANPTS